jgi:hypothetical protein
MTSAQLLPTKRTAQLQDIEITGVIRICEKYRRRYGARLLQTIHLAALHRAE